MATIDVTKGRATVLSGEQVLVTIGTPCTMSAVGSTETFVSLVRGAPDVLERLAFDAGIVTLDVLPGGAVAARWADGTAASHEELERRHGAQLRAGAGIRIVDELVSGEHRAVTDIAAPLPHDLADGGLRAMAGITFREIRDSAMRDMHALFDDDPRLGPSLQSQLFLHSGLGALAALPAPLAQLLGDPFEFRVAASAAFQGLDSLARFRSPTAADVEGAPRDKFAARLAASLESHGPALLSAMLAPAYPLGKSTKNPELLASLESASGYMRVPQTPMNSTGACASSLISLCDIAPQMLFAHPGIRRPRVVLWTSADAATRGGYGVLEAFGPNALMTSAKLDALNAGRPAHEVRPVGESLAPFDIDANGTVVGDGGSGVLLTTLDFALRNFLDITSVVVGWGQSGEAGGKAHFAGVGFGGENALIQALDVARLAHGDGPSAFGHLVAHATGTRTNSKTDLTTVANARRVAAERAGGSTLPRLTVGTPKAMGDGHTMGETGLKAVSQAIRHLLGEATVGVPTLRTLDPDLAHLAETFVLSSGTVPGTDDGGALCVTQGFGGYNGAVALRAANPDVLRRYDVDAAVLDAYLERWAETRRSRVEREQAARTRRGTALELAELHRWTSPAE